VLPDKPRKPGPTELTFGKYQGCCIHDVAENDPEYVVWLLDNTDIGKTNNHTDQFIVRVRSRAAVGRDERHDELPYFHPYDDDIPF